MTWGKSFYFEKKDKERIMEALKDNFGRNLRDNEESIYLYNIGGCTCIMRDREIYIIGKLPVSIGYCKTRLEEKEIKIVGEGKLEEIKWA